MASCDDDLSLLADDHHHHHHSHHHQHHHLSTNPHPHTHHQQHHPQRHHHQQFSPHPYLTKSSPIHPSPTIVPDGSSPNKVAAETEPIDYTTGNGAFDVHPFSADSDPNPFEDDSDPNNGARIDTSPNDSKRKDRDELSDGGISCNYKKSKQVAGGILVNGGGGGSAGGGSAGVGCVEYRKDREEWSDSAIDCLLEAYTEKYNQLNRGNLRGRDWEEVAAIVTERCENQMKTVEQCKNKVDNLKKRYKLERHRMTSGGGNSSSHWPWFKKMEAIVGNSLPVKVSASDDEKTSGGVGDGAGKQQKRYSMAPASLLGQISNMKSKCISNPRWQRVVFKIGGTALAGGGQHNVDPKVILLIAREVAMACRLGIQVALVVGGRNFFCGEAWITATGSDRTATYQIGMMATVMNALLIQSALEKMGVQTRVQTAFALPEVGEPFNRQRAIRHLEKGRVVIFGGVGAGMGNQLFSTDTVAALRATEIHANAILKGTSSCGVYECTSRNITFEHVSFRELASRGATLVDMMALTLCEENGIPVVVFNPLEPGNISGALCGEQVGTLIDQTGMIS